MVNTFTLSIIRLIQRLSIVLTIGSCAYVAFFFLSKNQDNPSLEMNNMLPEKSITLDSSSTLFNLKPYDANSNTQARDIFSLAQTNTNNPTENTPKGQLPDHLKVVGILIAHPSQIIIEDTLTKTTYFIDEGHPQGGINILKTTKDQMIITYQGQDISIPINKS